MKLGRFVPVAYIYGIPYILKNNRMIDSETKIALDALRRIVKELRGSSRSIERTHGVSSARLFVLQKLSESTVPLSINQLADRTQTDQSSVSVVVSRLVAGGWVLRQPSPKDGRRLELSLTPKGRALVKKAPRTPQEELVSALQKMPAAKRKKLAALLTEWVNLAGITDGVPPMFYE